MALPNYWTPKGEADLPDSLPPHIQELVEEVKNLKGIENSRWTSPENAARAKVLAERARAELMIILERREKKPSPLPTADVEERLKRTLEEIESYYGGVRRVF